MAKGLEFPIVYVVGLEENLFPSIMSINSREEIEEERRLFYVAMTRAKEKLILSHCQQRFRWGNIIDCEPSRFLTEVDMKFVNNVNTSRNYVRQKINENKLRIKKLPHKNLRKINSNSISKIKNKYDFIIIDCPPSLGLLTINALSAANSIIIPIQCEYLALEGLGKLLNTIKSIQKLHNKNLKIEGLLLTMYDVRLNLSNQVKKEVKTHFNEMVFKTVIHRNVKLGEATSFGKSIIDYDVSSKGADNYLNLANELITKN